MNPRAFPCGRRYSVKKRRIVSLGTHSIFMLFTFLFYLVNLLFWESFVRDRMSLGNCKDKNRVKRVDRRFPLAFPSFHFLHVVEPSLSGHLQP